MFSSCRTLATCLSAQCYIQNSRNESDCMMTALLVFLFFSHWLHDTFSSSLSFFSLCSLSHASSLHPSFVVSCLHNLNSEVTAETCGALISTQQEPPVCPSPCFMGSHDSRQKQIIAREIKGEKALHMHCLFSYFSLPHTLHLT